MFPVCFTFTTSSVAVVDTATNMVAATVNGMTYSGVVSIPINVAVTPDGKHVYAANLFSNSVSVIDTGSNAVVGTPIPAGISPGPVAITPDGKDAYVAAGSNVSVIDTATNTVVATVPVGLNPSGVAVTPDGKHAYVTNVGSNTVSVIDTASNTVTATVPVGNGPVAVGIIPDVPFVAFGANLVIAFGGAPNQDSFALQSGFTLSSTAPSIDPVTQPVTLQAGTFAVTIPPGSFVETPQGFFVFVGVINGVALQAAIEHTGTLRYAFQAKAVHASLTGTTNPVTVRLSLGVDSGITSITAKIFH